MDTQMLQMCFKGICRSLIRILCDDNTADVQPGITECINQTQHLNIIGDAHIASYLVFLYIICGYRNDDFHFLFQLKEHFQFTIRLKSRQNSGSMVIIKQLSAKLQI